MARYLFVRDGDALKLLKDAPPKVRPKRKRKTGRSSRPVAPGAAAERRRDEGRSL